MGPERKLKFCPTCGSKNVDWLLPQNRQKWVCKDCGYIGAFIIEDSKLAGKIRKRYLKYGRS